jgi:hypothetical protein
MPKRTTPSLAYSEYVSLDSDNSVQLWRARLLVIDAAKKVHPIFLKKLSVDVFPLYQSARERNEIDKALPRISPYEALPDSVLKSALSEWVRNFNAEAGWLKDGALRTLRDWYVRPELRKSLEWHEPHGRKERLVFSNDFEFRHQGWDVQLLTWQFYRQQLRKNFETRVSEYEKQTREFATSQGLVRARKKYSPDNLEWFVLYQFGGMSSKAIADRYARKGSPLDESTVLRGVKAAAKLIGWNQMRKAQLNHGRRIR